MLFFNTIPYIAVSFFFAPVESVVDGLLVTTLFYFQKGFLICVVARKSVTLSCFIIVSFIVLVILDLYCFCTGRVHGGRGAGCYAFDHLY